MTDRKAALIKLRDKMRAGECPMWTEMSGGIGLHPDNRHLFSYNAFHGSLDAAKALHEAVLPGWWWTVGTCAVSDDARISPEGDASVTLDGREWSEITDIDQRPPGNPARAWLLSILEALIEMEDTPQ